MTNYQDLATYREEHDPASMQRDVLAEIAKGVDARLIDAYLTRPGWISAGMPLHARIALRKQEQSECSAFFAARAVANQ